MILIVAFTSGKVRAQCTVNPASSLKNGYSIVACRADAPDDPAVVIDDITNYGARYSAGPLPVNIMQTHARKYLLSEFDGYQIMGLAVNSAGSEAFAATSALYGKNLGTLDNASAPAKIYRINLVTNAVSLLTTLDAAATWGIAAVDYDATHRQLFATNLDDGKIYRVNASTGSVLGSFDPMGANALNDGKLAPLGKRIAAVAYNATENRLYFSVWARDEGNNSTDPGGNLTALDPTPNGEPGDYNSVWSVALDAAGNFTGAIRLEMTLPNFATDYFSSPVFDIDFNKAGTSVLLAESGFDFRTTTGGPRATAHGARVIRYNGSTTNWVLDGPAALQGVTGGKYSIGHLASFGAYEDQGARGGVAWAYAGISNGSVVGDETFILATSDAAYGSSTEGYYFGYTFMSAAGGDYKTAVNVDLNGSVLNVDKYAFGDVDVLSCEIPCSILTSVIAGNCNPITNQYTVSGSISLTNTAGGTATISDGIRSTTIAVPVNATSVTWSLTGLHSGTGSHTVTVSLPGCGSTSATYNAPVSCTVAAVISVQSATVCSGSPVSLTASGCIGNVSWSTGATGNTLAIPSLTQTTSYTATCITVSGSSASSVGTVTVLPTPAVSLSANSLTATAGQSVTLTATGCQSGTAVWSTGQTGVMSVVVSPTATATYTVTCTTGPQCLTTASVVISIGQTPKLALTKVVSTKKAQPGEVVSYTLSLSNTGGAAATNVVVRDSLSAGAVLVAGSFTASQGVVTPGSPVSLWTLTSLPAGATATLTFSVSLTTEGITYNTATIPGDTARVCTSVPLKVCKGEAFMILLNAPVGYSSYQWFRNGTAIALATGSSYTATQVGEYTVQSANGLCPSGSCCPLIIEQDSVPVFTVMAQSPTCQAGQPRNDGRLTVTGLGQNPGQYRYAITEGSSFTAVNPTLSAVPADGVVASNLTGDRTYTVRIYNALGCYRDVTVSLPTNCSCPPTACVPVTILKIRALRP